MGKKPIVSVTYENETISIKNSLPYLKCVLRLSCVVLGPINGRFMGFLNLCKRFSLYIKVYLACENIRFSFALRRWGRFARRNVCDSATKIPY